jgi:hypothetical protein
MVVTSFAEDYTMTVKNALGRTETNAGSWAVDAVDFPLVGFQAVSR